MLIGATITLFFLPRARLVLGVCVICAAVLIQWLISGVRKRRR
jgi:hypothetical protein